ncbi:hypothetical protein [Phenylobacterium sp.]|uniref:hypothetical protein n=1 Tax=Phenylobacterium sp. TaxID=1871053 RepID=UPI00272FCAF6|nr:hypothetical protein [Phenylobacterium sp.]MDP2214775.1 hypothetical protein [Phenylobacterium sp.]
MSNRFEEIYRVTPDTDLTDELLNRIFRDLDDRLAKAEIARLSETQAFGIVLDRVLSRSEGVISSLRDQLLALTELQWLTARSDTPRTLEVGTSFALSIIDEDRALFAPGAFALLAWTTGAPDHYAIVSSLGFDRGIGQWDVKVEAFVGDPGPHAEWQISSVAGATLAQLALLTQGQDALAATVAARDVVTPKHEEVVNLYAEVLPASEQAIVARNQAVTTAAGLFPWGFSQDGVFWTASPEGAPAALANYAAEGAAFVTEAAYGRVLQSNTPGQVLPRGVIAPVPGRRYRIEVRARVKTNKTVGGGAAGLDLYQLDADFGTPSLVVPDVLAVAGLPQSDAAFTVADGVVTFGLDYLAPATPPPYLRPRFNWNQAGGDSVVQVLSMLIYDITAAYDADQLAASLDSATINGRLDDLEDLSAIAATVAQVRAGSATTVTPSPAVTDAALEPVVVADGATVTWSLTAAPHGHVTLGGNRLIGPPTGAKLGKFYSLRISSAGDYAPAFDAACFDFGFNGAGTYPVGAAKYAVLDVQCISTAPLKFRSNLWRSL